MPGALFSRQILPPPSDFSPGLTGLLATSRLTGGRDKAILAQWAKDVQLLCCHFFLTKETKLQVSQQPSAFFTKTLRAALQ